MTRLILVATFLITTTTSAIAEEAWQVAHRLGTVLASETACELSFDQAAIARYIEENVPAEDMSFPGQLDASTGGARYNIEQMSESSRTAHCTEVRRIAESYGFIAAD